jgi:hypothetical protein
MAFLFSAFVHKAVSSTSDAAMGRKMRNVDIPPWNMAGPTSYKYTTNFHIAQRTIQVEH